MPYAIERLKYLGEGIPLKGVAFDGDQNVEWAVVVDDAQVSASQVLR
jgi:hypothetical protein